MNSHQRQHAPTASKPTLREYKADSKDGLQATEGLIPLSHLRTDAADRAASAAIGQGSVLYAYCIRTVSVDFRRDPPRSAAQF